MNKIAYFLFVLFLPAFAFAQTTDWNTVDVCSPQEMIGNEFYFARPSLPFAATCFYNYAAIDKNSYNKKTRYKADAKGETPQEEFLDRKFRASRIIQQDNSDISKGFVLELIREDGERMGLLFNKYNPKKEYNPKTVTFSDLFYKSSYTEDDMTFSAFMSGKPTKCWTTQLGINVFITSNVLDSLSARYSNLNNYHQDYVFAECGDKEILNYTLDSLTANSDGIRIHLRDNLNHILTLGQAEASQLRAAREAAIKKHEEIKGFENKYDSASIRQFANLKGQSVWALGGIFKDEIYLTTVDENGKTKTTDSYGWLKGLGNAVESWESGNLYSMMSYYGVSCIIDDIVFRPNHLDAKTLKRLKSDKKYAKSKIIYDYCYYLILRQDSTKEYRNAHSQSLRDDNSRAYILIDDVKPEFFLSDNEFQRIKEAYHKWEQEDIDAFMNHLNTRYQMAERLWGKEIANHIKRGEVRFGFTTEMCRMAYDQQIYRESKVSTPFGLATCYDFYQKEEKLYFIDNELIGIQFKLGQIKYRN